MNAQQLKNSILQEAIEGRLVPQDSNDEPASVLLDKIRKEKARLVKEGKLKKSALKEDPISDDDKLFTIPSTWEWCKLGWIGDWGAGATPAKGTSEFYINGTIPWLRTGELNNGIVYDSEIKVTPYALQKCSLRKCQVGDVLIAMYGATIGKVAIAGIELTTNQACCACTPYQVYNKYLLYYLMASKQRFIELGEGGAQPNISREKILVFPFPLPPLAEQKRIVAKIEELLPKVEAYGKAQEKLDKLNEVLPEKLKKSILQEAIEGRLVPQDPNDEPASILLDKIRKEKARLVKEGKLKKKDLEEIPISEDEKPFEIPESWEWCRLRDIISLKSGECIKIRSLNQNLQYPVYGGNGINGTYDSYNVEVNILIIGRVGFYCGCVHKTTSKAWVTDNALIVTTKTTSLNIDFLNYALKWLNLSSTSNSTAQPVVSGKGIYPLLLPLPPLAEQKRIVEKIEQLLHEIDKLKV